MTLVVAQVSRAGIDLVGDTMITYDDDPEFTSKVLENALPKLVILRPDTCIGLAGRDPFGSLRAIVDMRNESHDEIVTQLANHQDASYLIASVTGGSRLTEVRYGRIDDRTFVRRGWIGLRAAYDRFREAQAQWPDSDPWSRRLMTSLQHVTSFGQVTGVGGYNLGVTLTDDGFAYFSDPTRVFGAMGPWIESHLSSARDDKWPAETRLDPLFGVRPTVGAVGFHVSSLNLAILFPHLRPYEPVSFQADSPSTAIRRALTAYGQHLRRHRTPWDP
jgi:hypothetical protein